MSDGQISKVIKSLAKTVTEAAVGAATEKLLEPR